MRLTALRVHSWFSFLAAASSPDELCRRAAELGHSALALTDVGGLWGVPAFEAAAARHRLRPIYGVELPTPQGRIVLLARDQEGYRSLCRLVSAFHLDAGFDPVRTVAREQAGLFVLASEPRLLVRLALRLEPGVLHVGLPPRLALRPARPSRQESAEAIPRGRKLPDPPAPVPAGAAREAARRLELPLVALPDVYRAESGHRERQRALLAVKNATVLDLAGEPGGVELPGPEEAAAWYAGDEEAVEAAGALAEQCRAELPRAERPLFPPYRSIHGESAEERLAELARLGLERLYGPGHGPARRRLAEELAAIGEAGFAPYFLVLEEIARFAREKGIPCMGRGSAAASLTARCLGLTEPDPLRHGLVFERFLNPGRREDPPDVDLDFCWQRRADVVRHVYESRGAGRVATLCTLVHLGVRGAVREAALACGVPPALAGRLSERFPHGHAAGMRAALAEAGDLSGVLGSERLAGRVAETAELLHGAPHHMGLHPGGTVVAPAPLADLMPLQLSAEGLVASQFDKHFIERTGAIKLDLLGNRGLTVVDRARSLLAALGRPALDLERASEGDPATARLIREGRTLGCFQIESPAMRQLLKGLGADTLERVIQALALVRPGPAAGGMKELFLRRARGLEQTPRLDPGVDELLAETHGVMLYQEDVLRVASAAAGLTLAQADRLRQDLGRTRRDPRARERLGQGFVLAAAGRGMEPSAAGRLWTQLERFTGYSFCKAHAVSYGRLAWKCAWLKAHEPAVFFAALLSAQAGMYARTVYVNEARRLGLQVLGPHVNRSGAAWLLEGESTLRASLVEVRGLGEEAAAALLAAREARGPYRDLEDLRARNPSLPRDALENLILAGALDGLGENRGRLLLETRLGRVEPGGWLLPPRAAAPPVPGPVPAEGARLAMSVLGFSPGAHPLRLLGLRRTAGTTGCGLALRRAGPVAVEGWVIAHRRVTLERGSWVLFLTLEDETGLVEVVVRPGAGLPGRVAPWSALRVEGTVEPHTGAPCLAARRVLVRDRLLLKV